MTALHPAARAGQVVRLDDRDTLALRELLARDPIVNVVVASRLDIAGRAGSARVGGELLGLYGTVPDRLDAAVFHGGNLVPVGSVFDWSPLTAVLSGAPRHCSSVVGPLDAVSRVWPALEPVWGPPRAIRSRQPVLVTDSAAPGIEPDPLVRPTRIVEFENYLPAAAAMFAEELGVAPYEPGDDTAELAYRRRVGALVAGGRSLVRLDDDGRILFKAEFGAVTADTAQVQGVWVRPDRRGCGVGTAAMAAVIVLGLRLAPTVSLYVNDFNAPALRMYRRLGMRQAATLATVLL